MIRRHCTDIDQVCPQQHQSLPKHAMTKAISALIGNERVDVGRVDPIHRPAMDGQPATEPTDHQLARHGPRRVSQRLQSAPETIHDGSNSHPVAALPAMPVPPSRITLL